MQFHGIGTYSSCRVQAVVIDFEIASNTQDKKCLRLAENEIVEYRRKHPNIAPEVI